MLERRDTPSRVSPPAGISASARKQHGDAARACYSREVGRELAAVGGVRRRRVTFAGALRRIGEVTFAAADVETAQAGPLLCDLHARVGVTDEQVPSWLGWTEPLAQAAPVS